jgi:hypothetical protein
MSGPHAYCGRRPGALVEISGYPSTGAIRFGTAGAGRTVRRLLRVRPKTFIRDCIAFAA